jgi:hypothetical protein
MNYNSKCGKYLRMADAFTIDQAAALWCDGDPGEDVALLRAAAPCFTIKHDLILQAVLGGRLPVTREGAGPRINASQTTIAREKMRIMRDDLVAWFEALATGDRPAFLFDDAVHAELPDVSEVAELTADRAIAIMAWLLQESRPAMRIGERPNVAAIGIAVADLARTTFHEDVRGFASFHKRLSRALKTLQTDSDKGLPSWRRK